MVKDNTFASILLDVIFIVVLFVLAVSCIYPLWYTLCISVSDKSAVAGGMVTLWPVGLNFKSYQTIMQDAQFFKSFRTSLIRVVTGTALNLAVITMMAYPLSKTAHQFRGRNAWMWFVVLMMIFNSGLIPWYMAMKSLGMVNTLWSLIVAGGLPTFEMILVMNYFRNIPKEIEDAAIMDGAGPWQLFLNIYLPISKPVIATVALFSIVGHWNDFFIGLIMMTRQEYYPLQTYIQQMVVQRPQMGVVPDPKQLEVFAKLSNQSLDAAKIFIAMVPALLVYLFLQKFIVTGITLGSVKE